MQASVAKPKSTRELNRMVWTTKSSMAHSPVRLG